MFVMCSNRHYHCQLDFTNHTSYPFSGMQSVEALQTVQGPPQADARDASASSKFGPQFYFFTEF